MRQWRFNESTVSSHDDAAQIADVATRGQGLWKEMPMPKGSEHYPLWSQQILREARLGRLLISPQIYERGGFGRRAKEDDKENDGDIGVDGTGEDRRANAPAQGFTAKRWLQTPKHMEEPEVEYLAKRRRGLSSMHGVADGVAAAVASSVPMRKTRVRRVDDQGRTNMWEVLVPEGHPIDGEVDEPGMAENLGISISRPAPGTVIAGLGIANDDGIIVVSTTNIPLVSVVSTPVRPRGPRRKGRGGFRRGRGKKMVSYGDRGGVSASAEALYASRDAADVTMEEADVTTTGDAVNTDAAAGNATQEGGEEEESEGEVDEEDADEDDGEAEEAEEDGDAERDEDDAEGEGEADEDEDMDREDDDDDREEGEITPSPEPPDATELVSHLNPVSSTLVKASLALDLPPPVIPVSPPPVEHKTAEIAQADRERSESPKLPFAKLVDAGRSETTNVVVEAPATATPEAPVAESATAEDSHVSSHGAEPTLAEPILGEASTVAPRAEDLPESDAPVPEEQAEGATPPEIPSVKPPSERSEQSPALADELAVNIPTTTEAAIVPQAHERAENVPIEESSKDREVDLLGSLERDLEQQQNRASESEKDV